VGQDFSQWRDVARTLRGEYGARMTRDIPADDASGVMHVAAPIQVQGRIAGVLTVAKPVRTVQRFIDRAERKVLMGGLLLLALSAAVGVAVTLWMVWNVRRLRDYALSVQGPADGEHAATPTPPLAVPEVPGELGDLARAMDRMRERLEGRDYIEGYVRALTHELKSPVAAIRGAGELLQDDLPPADRQQFALQVVEQSERLQRLIDRLLELSKLEQRHPTAVRAPVALHDCARAAIAHTQARAGQRGITLTLSGTGASGPWEAELVTLALTNLLDNAIDFAPSGSTVGVELDGARAAVQDSGPGVPGYALPRLGERFFTTARPDGSRSGSGLGLAIVQRVMALHGGRMAACNTHPGLRVELTFPGGGSSRRLRGDTLQVPQ
jgi:two-component system sensor histidine kinase CreC